MSQPFNDTNNNDHLVGTNQDDVFVSSAGNDPIVGDDGFDTVDYGHLGKAVTLQHTGVIKKGHYCSSMYSFK
ncbi:MAG: hypothetical protein AAF383_11520 [Cyanobacteria bacterium P01_A01_bin.83]